MVNAFKLFMNRDKEFCSILKKQLKIEPNNVELYELAFLQRATSITLPDGTIVNNERLEFLGDAIIHAIIADYLFRRYPYEKEGFLTQLRSRIVNRTHLDSIASQMGLIDLVKMYAASTENLKKHISGDIFEALIGAMYLDKGFEKTLIYIAENILQKYINVEQLANTETDFKSRLFEWGQKHKLKIDFKTIEERKETAKNSSKFSVQASISGVPIAKGTGRSKKEAEQMASQQALTFVSSSSSDFSSDELVRYLGRSKKR